MPARGARQVAAVPYQDAPTLTASRHVRIAVDPVSIGFLCPFARVVDADARAAGDLSGGHGRAFLDGEDARREIETIVRSRDAERPTELARTVGLADAALDG